MYVTRTSCVPRKSRRNTACRRLTPIFGLGGRMDVHTTTLNQMPKTQLQHEEQGSASHVCGIALT